MTRTTETSPTELQHCLKGLDYFADKAAVVKAPGGNHASQEVIGLLQQLPGDKYASPAEVMHAYGELRKQSSEDEPMRRLLKSRLAMLGLALAFAGASCSRSGTSEGASRQAAGPDFTDQQPRVNTAAGGVGSGPTGTQGGQPADVPPAR